MTSHLFLLTQLLNYNPAFQLLHRVLVDFMMRFREKVNTISDQPFIEPVSRI
jgi:hypothetical protein